MIKLFSLAARNVLRNKRRSLLTALGIIVGVIALIILGGYINSVNIGYREAMIHQQSGHIQVVKPNYFNDEQTLFTYSIPQEEIAKIKEICSEISEISEITSRIHLNGLIGNDDRSCIFIATGVVPGNEKAISEPYDLPVNEGEYLSEDQPFNVVIGCDLADRLKVKIGDEIIAMGYSSINSLEAIRVKICGLIKTGIAELDDKLVTFSREAGEELVLTDNVHKIVILLENTEATESVVHLLDSKFKQAGLDLEIKTWDKLLTNYQQVMGMFNAIFGIVTLIIVIVILFSISNTVYMSIMERSREIATLRAIGTARPKLFACTIIEASVIALGAAFIGIVVSLILGHVINGADIILPPYPGQTEGTPFDVLINIGLVFQVIRLNFVIAVVASILPAIHAIRIDIPKGLRYV